MIFFNKNNNYNKSIYILTSLFYTLNQNDKSQIIKYFLLDDLFNVRDIDAYPDNIYIN